jgi:protein MpaA
VRTKLLVVAATIALFASQGVPSTARASTLPVPAGTDYAGFVTGFGAASGRASLSLSGMTAPLVGVASAPDSRGFWAVASDGGVFTGGTAGFAGSVGGLRLSKPVVGISPTPSGRGYWLVAADGGIFSFGDARFFGSTGSVRLNKPIVSMIPTRSGNGYWLVAADGGIFTFGDARFLGSTGSVRLNRPVIGGIATRTGRGYELVASDGGVFTFGDAKFFGSGASSGQSFVGLVPVRSTGYWLLTSSGTLVAFGAARPASFSAHGQVVGVGALPSGNGGWVASVVEKPQWQTIGTSVQGRPLRVLRVGHGPRRVLWIGGTHGNEREGSVATANLPQAFASAGLADDVTLWILEDENPDGSAANTRYNANGVDLNRNLPASDFDSSNPRNGGRPLSQPESAALFRLVNSIQPDVILSAHADSTRPPYVIDDGPLLPLAALFSQLSGMPVTTSDHLNHATPGSLGSWWGVDQHKPVLTIEYGFGSDPTRDWESTRSAILGVIGGS